VIKESVEVKSIAFEQLFLPYGLEVARRVRSHHEQNSGVSRFDKLPLYLSWANEPVSEENIEYFCTQFSAMVKQAVISSPWVPGVLEWLQENHKKQKYVLVTATPQNEIEAILEELGIIHFFDEIYGAPTAKTEAIASVLKNIIASPNKILMIGDSLADYEAAMSNNIPFLLRCTPLNISLQNIGYDSDYEDDYGRWILIRNDVE
jgi:phosphoglycolate phosphatase-like HAD superfamily hydrolase